MTGPMKLVKSCGTPTFSFATSESSSSLKLLLHNEAGTYKRESAEHFWPI